MNPQTIGHRTPIVPNGVQLTDPELLNREWYFVTEAVRRESLTDPAIQAKLIEFIPQPVDQNTAASMLEVLDDNKRITKIAKRTGGHVLDLLGLPEVPEDLIKPDLRTTNRLRNPIEDAQYFAKSGDSEAEQTETLAAYSESGAYTKGITEDERDIIARKYAYARDVKLLAMGAELAKEGMPKFNESGEARLASGIQIKADPERVDLAKTLLDPNKWESRKQLKDRVYEIVVDGKKYILKERKTDRHTDTHRNGHHEGLTVAQEFKVSKKMRAEASLKEPHIQLSWEEGLGYVEYPDGFQFGIFSYEEGLQFSYPGPQLADGITKHKDMFKDEFEKVKTKAAEYKAHPLATQNRMRGEEDGPLTYQEFARLKASQILHRAHQLQDGIVMDLGYENFDTDGIAYRLIENGTGIELVGFDYEYFRDLSRERAAEIKERIQKRQEQYPHTAVGYLGNTSKETAAYLAILDVNGQLPDVVKHMK